MTQRRLSIALLVAACLAPAVTTETRAASDLVQLAQAQPAPASTPAPIQPPAPAATPDPAAPATAQPAVEEPIGNVATLTGSATVTRNKATTPLQPKADIYANDIVETAAKSSLGITFNDATTFKLSANSRITIDKYVYEEGGKANAGLFDVAKGTLAFVAAGLAKTGDMKIATPTATLGIRGTTGLVDVPEGATARSNNVAIKLYPDADGRVGHIEIDDRSGVRLGALTRGASGFTIRPDGVGGARFAAVPLAISPQQVVRDQGFVRQLFSAQTLGRRVVEEQRAFRRANPNLAPNRGNAPGQTAPQQQDGLPGQNRTAPQGPGQPARPGQQQPGKPGRQGGQQPQPGTPQQTRTQQPGQPPGPARADRHSLPGQPGGAPLPQTGQPGATTPSDAKPPTRPQQGLPRPGVTPLPDIPQRGGQSPIGAPSPRRPVIPPPAVAPPALPQPGQPPALQQPPRQGALPQRPPGLQQRPALQPRPALQQPRRAPPDQDKRRRIF